MKNNLSRPEAEKRIIKFFGRKRYTSDEVRKIRNLAMSKRIQLGVQRKNFCKKCLSKLKGQIRVSKGFKIVKCSSCGYLNRIKLS